MAIKFIINVINAFPVTPLGVHVGAIVQQPSGSVEIGLGQYKEKPNVDAALRQISPYNDESAGTANVPGAKKRSKFYKKTGTAAVRQMINNVNNFGSALRQGKNMLVGGKRQVPKTLLAMLNSKATDDLSKPSQELRDAGVGVVCACGSDQVDQSQLNTIAGGPENVVSTTSFSQFPSILGSVTGKLNDGR